ncbi:MAG: NUDIX hydrolase [Cyclobacteriaceae bacterium]
MENSITEEFVNRFRSYVPGISLDCVVFGYSQGILKVLLLKYRNAAAWALPGGFLPADMEMEDAVNDILYMRTGLRNIFLSQYHTFSSMQRGWDINLQSKLAFLQAKAMWPEAYRPELKAWFNQRFISTAYLALIQADKASPVPDDLSELCQWMPVNDLPGLVLDHKEMIEMALQHLKVQINYMPIGKSLLTDKFTMSDLQSLYESIFQKRLDRANFQRKILKLGILKRHEKLMTGAANKAPYLYSIEEEVYDQLLKNGIGFSMT